MLAGCWGCCKRCAGADEQAPPRPRPSQECPGLVSLMPCLPCLRVRGMGVGHAAELLLHQLARCWPPPRSVPEGET